MLLDQTIINPTLAIPGKQNMIEATATNFRPIPQSFVLSGCLEITRKSLTSFIAARIATDMVDANMAARVLCVI
jgi:hypothetical protein